MREGDPQRSKHYPITGNATYNAGGIVDSVSLLLTPAVRVGDVHVTPDWKTGVARIEADLLNAGTRSANALVTVRIAPSAPGRCCGRRRILPSPGAGCDAGA